MKVTTTTKSFTNPDGQATTGVVAFVVAALPEVGIGPAYRTDSWPLVGFKWTSIWSTMQEPVTEVSKDVAVGLVATAGRTMAHIWVLPVLLFAWLKVTRHQSPSESIEYESGGDAGNGVRTPLSVSMTTLPSV